MKRVISRDNEKKRFPQLNMTSMIDVIFLLLVFFVFTTNFNEIEKFLPMSLKLPGQSLTERKPDTPPLPTSEVMIRVVSDSGGNVGWFVNDIECRTEPDLTAVLEDAAESNKEQSVVIYPSDSVTVEHVLDVYGLCRSVGLTQIRFAAKKN